MLKKLLALVLAGAMVLGSVSMAFADPSTGDTTGAPTKGSITINSPIVGATYKLYKIFDETTNTAGDAFSYTIDSASPFYGAVVAYASDATKGLILTPIQAETLFDEVEVEGQTEKQKVLTYAKYNVTVSTTENPVEGYGNFDAQAFGKAMQDAVTNGSPAVEEQDLDKTIVKKDAVASSAITTAVEPKTVTITTDNTSDTLAFEELPLGYYLINPTYPTATPRTVTMGEGANEKTFGVDDLKLSDSALANIDTYIDTLRDDNNQALSAEDKAAKKAELTEEVKTALARLQGDYKLGEQTFTVADLELTTGENSAASKVDEYVEATVNDAYVDKYITDHGITTNKDGSPLTAAGKAEYKADLKKALTDDALAKVLEGLTTENGSESDKNVKEPTLVFLDSAKPDAVINEKNELNKWDVPVNPTGDTQPGTPDHGEPEGGKNIVVQEATATTPAYYADWSEANTGESVHYQLRVNAMNFMRTGETDDTVEQVKEYFLADYQSGHMTFDVAKGLRVSIWQGDNANKSQDSTTTTATDGSTPVNVTKNVTYTKNADTGEVTYTSAENAPYLDYTEKAEDFFMNSSNQDANPAPTDVFGDEAGIMVPWTIVSKDASLKSQYPIYTETKVPAKDENGDPIFKTETIAKDDDNNLIPVMAKNTDGSWIKDETAAGYNGYQVVANHYVSVDNHEVATTVTVDGKTYNTPGEGKGYVLGNDGKPIVETESVYTYSIYNSDVTIVVDYWMILKDDAVVDEPGNKNYAQFAWNPVDNKNEDGSPKTPTNPDEENDKPSQKEEVDEATVYTFALAWVKVDDEANPLQDAEFELPFYVKPASQKDGGAEGTYVFVVSKKAIEDAKAAVEAAAEGDEKTAAEAELARLNALKETGTDKVTTTATSAVITIKGVEQGTYSITETKAPAGYNKLAAPFDVEAKKSGSAVTTKTKTIIYLDVEGKITSTVTTNTTEYETDPDSYNNASAPASEEKSVPVYQFDPVVNKQGTELPSTGGIGTTIFYAGGAILVLLAGVLLVSKRRYA